MSDVPSCINLMCIFWHCITNTFFNIALIRTKSLFFAHLPGYFSFADSKRSKKEVICNSLWIELLLYYPPDTLRFINQRRIVFPLKPHPLSVRSVPKIWHMVANADSATKTAKSFAGPLIHGPEIKSSCANAKGRKRRLRLMTLFWADFSFDGEFVRRNRLVFIFFSGIFR